MKKAHIATALCLASAVLFSGCKSAQVAFPDGTDKNGFDTYEVRDRQSFALFSGKFTFGTYIVDWTRSATSSDTASSIAMMSGDRIISSHQTYTVALTDSDGISWTGKCRSESKTRTKTTKHKNSTTTETEVLSNTLVAAISSSDNQAYELSMNQSYGYNADKSGMVKGGNLAFRLDNTRKVDGMMFDSRYDTGYFITESGKLVAVVEVVNDGRVYVLKGLDKKKAPIIYAIAAVLLGYRDMVND